MAAIDQPSGPALTIREAAAACRLSPRTIRRKLTAGAFPNAQKTGSGDDEHDGAWMIPVADLEAAGLDPTLVHPTLTSPPRVEEHDEHDTPTVLELVRSDRFGRLRAELAEAVASAEIALLRAEAERWRTVADERAAALDRADNALKALTTALSVGQLTPASAPATNPPAVRAGGATGAECGRGAYRRTAQRRRVSSTARTRGGDALHRDAPSAARSATPAKSLVAVLALELRLRPSALDRYATRADHPGLGICA